MPPRTRAADNVPEDADPEFLALTPRQRNRIDRAFDRATATGSSRPSRKKRKVEVEPEDAGGGFMDLDDGEGEGGFMDAGGFIPDDDDDAGGFMPDDDDGDGNDGGGFLPEDNDDDIPKGSLNTSRPAETGEERRIPFRSLPGVLSSLNLPSDEDVLAVFRASAAGWGEGGDEEIDLAVGLKDFRAVCAALMGPDEGEEGLSSGDEDAYREEGRAGRDDEDGDSSLSELSDEYQEPAKKGKPGAKTRKGKKAKGKGNKEDLREKARVKLNSRQKEIVNDLWGMIKPQAEQEQRGGHILGREEVKRKVRELGEMWTEDEITDMVTLFSTQHQGRGLSYDDFGAIMVRAGLA